MARKILLADDSVTAQNMGRKILTDAGYDVITVNNGSAALKRVAEQKPDLIVLDVYMPGYSGLEVCVRLKDAPETARIPILLTVGKLEPFKPEESHRVRADGFIVKPFEASELLSALTRLEDRMVPSQAEGGRFSSSASGIERFSGGDSSNRKSEGRDANDTGWKNRLRFPSKKKEETQVEPEPEPDFVTPSSFRDFRRGGGKAPASGPFPSSTGPAVAQAPAVVPDIPRDITPEELDALSELAAKLDGAPAPAQAASLSEQASTEVAAPPVPQAEVVAPQAEIQEMKVEPAPVVSPEVKTETEVPPTIEMAVADSPETASAASTSSLETVAPPAEAIAVETPVADPVTFQTEAAVAQEPAPIDRDDEPTFATVPVVEEAAAVAEPVAEVAVVPPPVAEAAAESNSEAAPSEEPKLAEPVRTEEPSTQAAANVPETPAAQGSSPSAEELAEALRFLTPSQPTTSLAEAGAALADVLARSAGSRWVAEAVALSPEEASGSLEAEMFRTFSPSASASPATTETPATSGTVSESSVAVSETIAEIAAESAPLPVEATPANVTAESESSSSIEQPQEQLQSLNEKEQVQETTEEPVAATTFADAVQDQEEEVPASAEEPSGIPVETPAQAHEDISSSENGPGGEEDMSKETKGKGGKSTWHQIRSGAPASASDAVEAAKQSEESPKTMAAAASAEGAGADASSIASIVDSVLADLRPKIVEEIARQLSKK